jgi:hypothetical protein
MKKYSFLAMIIWLSVMFVYAQPEYNRNALTLVALNFNENHSSELLSRFSGLKVPDKFYNNPLSGPVINMGGTTRPVNEALPDLLRYIPDDFILQQMMQKKTAHAVLSTWFNRQADGSFNVDVLKERGLYNANDNEFISASASKRGTSTLMDMGLKLVNQSYILVFDFYDIMTMNEYYDKKAIAADKRVSNGYKAKAKAYLYKLDFSETVATEFFNNYWTTPNDVSKASKSVAFENAVFRLIPASKQYIDVEAIQYNPEKAAPTSKQKSREELMDELLRTAMDNVTVQMEAQIDAFRVKAMVSAAKPISAKIGKKEGLAFDQRYLVYENQMKKDGSVAKKLVGAVKSMKVTDNRSVATGHSEASEFYQIWGGKVDDMGMYLEQKNDAGLNLFFGYTFQGMQGYTGRLEYYVSKLMGDLVPKGKSGMGLTSLKVYVEGAYDSRKYELLDEKNFKFTRVSLGLGKEIYPAPFIHIEPFIGYGIEFTDWTLEGTKFAFDTPFVELGGRLGLNLAYNIQLIGSYNYNLLFKTTVKNNDTGDKDNFDYDEFFDDRIKAGVSAGLRIAF